MAKSLTRHQFQAFPHAPRPPQYGYLIEEHEWYADDSEGTLGVLFRDKQDDDWAYVVLQPDADSVFKWVDGEHSFAIKDVARQKLLDAVDRAAQDLKASASLAGIA